MFAGKTHTHTYLKLRLNCFKIRILPIRREQILPNGTTEWNKCKCVLVFASVFLLFSLFSLWLLLFFALLFIFNCFSIHKLHQIRPWLLNSICQWLLSACVANVLSAFKTNFPSPFACCWCCYCFGVFSWLCEIKWIAQIVTDLQRKARARKIFREWIRFGLKTCYVK